VLPTRPGKRGRVEEQSNTRQDKTKETNKRGPRKIIILIVNNSFFFKIRVSGEGPAPPSDTGRPSTHLETSKIKN
jgi:hypothetical protein